MELAAPRVGRVVKAFGACALPCWETLTGDCTDKLVNDKCGDVSGLFDVEVFTADVGEFSC